MITLEELIENGIAHGKKIVLEGKEARGLLTFACPPGEDGRDVLMVMAVPDYGNPARKDAMRAFMRMTLDTANAYCYAFICEAWMGMVSAKKRKDLDPDYCPSEDPERIEVITAAGADHKGRKLMRVIEIKRTPNANTKFKVKFEEFETPAGMIEAESPLLDLLPKQTMQ